MAEVIHDLQKKQTKGARRRYSSEFKAESLGLAEQIGVPGAGLYESQVYNWRKKARYEAS